MKIHILLILIFLYHSTKCIEEINNGHYLSKDLTGEYSILLAGARKIVYIKEDKIMIKNRELNENLNFFTFLFHKISIDQDNQKGIYHIEETKSSKLIGVLTKRLNLIYNVSPLKNDKINDKEFQTEWYLKQLDENENIFLIQNKNGCYLQVVGNNRLSCNNLDFSKKINDLVKFKIIKVLEKVPKEHSKLLDETPIDVLIKYIDLSDPNLVREGIPQIKKDEDNEELRYAVRSVIKNIPWVRKIFILMPNEKVRYFKDYQLIKDKIIYVKDKDLLGFDSASSPVFQFNLWKMKQFGLSENFILMDDDCIIAKPLNKSDFFYEDNGEILPAIIANNYGYMDHDQIYDKFNFFETFINKSTAHQDKGFDLTMASTWKLNYEIFNHSLIMPRFTHNAVAMKQEDLHEIYNEIKTKYKYANETLSAIFRHSRSLQCQAFFFIYTANKYHRKSNPISAQYLICKTSNFFAEFLNTSLICFNTPGNGEFSKKDFNEIKAIMEKLFPEPTDYEIYDYTLVTNIGYEILWNLYNKEKSYKNLNIFFYISLGINVVVIFYIIIRIFRKLKKINSRSFNKNDSYKSFEDHDNHDKKNKELVQLIPSK